MSERKSRLGLAALAVAVVCGASAALVWGLGLWDHPHGGSVPNDVPAVSPDQGPGLVASPDDGGASSASAYVFNQHLSAARESPNSRSLPVLRTLPLGPEEAAKARLASDARKSLRVNARDIGGTAVPAEGLPPLARPALSASQREALRQQRLAEEAAGVPGRQVPGG